MSKLPDIISYLWNVDWYGLSAIAIFVWLPALAPFIVGFFIGLILLRAFHKLGE